jgi:hypothetical protein
MSFYGQQFQSFIGRILVVVFTAGTFDTIVGDGDNGGQALVRLKELGGKDKTLVYAKVAPWSTLFTAGILLWYGTNGLLMTLLGYPSIAGLLTLG